MKLGISMSLPHNSPEEWAQKHKALGLSAVVFPCRSNADMATIDGYAEAAKAYGLTIAEVGAWTNVLIPDETERKKKYDYCLRQLELAEYVGALCCVNTSGAKGEYWAGGYRENYSQETYAEIVETVQSLIDTVKPKKTFYTLEPMPWMHPDSPEDYLQLIKDVDREAFAVHLDVVNMISTPQRYLFNREFTDKTVAMLGKYTKSCHIKDVHLSERYTIRLEECGPGDGEFPLRYYVSKMHEKDPDMPVILEHLSTDEEYIKY